MAKPGKAARPEATVVELFEGIDAGDIEVKVFAKDAAGGNITVKNKTTTRTVTSSASFDDGKWHHVAASMSSTGMVLYVDGKVVGSRSDTTSGRAYNGYFRVGSDRAMGGANTFSGRIDEVALYPKPLTATQVAAR